MKRVLIADDEPIERMIVTRTIQKYFPEELAVVSAVNGREAVEQFFAENCQIALLDIEMPGMNGLEAAEQIREREIKTAVLFFLRHLMNLTMPSVRLPSALWNIC